LNLKILALLLFYYGILSAFFVIGSSVLPTDANTTTDLSTLSGNVTGSELELGGFFSVGVSFLRFAGFIAFGIGLPADTPTAMVTVFIIFESCLTILTVGFIISSIWDG